MTRTCDELGVCNGRHCHDVGPCPDYDLIACNSCDCGVDDRVPCPHNVFECEVPCADAPAPTRPLASVVYPFAPGVIERTTNSTGWFDEEDCGLPLSLGELAFVAALVSGCGALGGLLATWAMRWAA